MSTKSLLATLFVLGSSTAVLAKPAPKSLVATARVTAKAPIVRDHRAPAPRPQVRDHRFPAPQPEVRDHRGRDRGGWYGHDRGGHDRDRGHRAPPIVVRPPVIVTPPPVVVTPPVDSCSNVRIGAKASVYTGPVATRSPWGWTALTQPTMIARGFEQINVGADKGAFQQLQLVANSGSTNVTQVVIQFADLSYQTIPVHRTLDASSPTLQLDLAGGRRAIQRIIVDGSSSYGARYSVRAF